MDERFASHVESTLAPAAKRALALVRLVGTEMGSGDVQEAWRALRQAKSAAEDLFCQLHRDLDMYEPGNPLTQGTKEDE